MSDESTRATVEKTASELLAAAGLRRTRARESLLALLYESDRPLSHQEIAEKPGGAEFDRVTLYRTMATLEQAGLIHRVQGVDGFWRFSGHSLEAPGCPGDHPHFLCLDCGRMTCLKDQSLPWVSVPHESQVYGKQLVVYGRCPACSRKEAQKGKPDE